MTYLNKRHLINIREIVKNMQEAINQRSMLDIWSQKQADNLIKFLNSEIE